MALHRLEFIQPLRDLHLLLLLSDLPRPPLGREKSKQPIPAAMSPQGKTPHLSPLQHQRNPGRFDHRIRASKRRIFYPPNTMTPSLAQHQIDPSPVLRKLYTWMPQLQLFRQAAVALIMAETFPWARLPNHCRCRCSVDHKLINPPPHLPTEKSSLLVVKADTYGLEQSIIAHVKTVLGQHTQSSGHQRIGEWSQRAIKVPTFVQKAYMGPALPRLGLPHFAHMQVFQSIPAGVLR